MTFTKHRVSIYLNILVLMLRANLTVSCAFIKALFVLIVSCGVSIFPTLVCFITEIDYY